VLLHFAQDVVVPRRYLVVSIALSLGLGAPRPSDAQHCPLLHAALEATGADPGTTLLLDSTAMGVPNFAFNAYAMVGRGDTALGRVMMTALEGANKTRARIPSCLVDSLGWRTISDTTLLGIFAPAGPGWRGFRERYSATPRFAMVSVPAVSGDTATVYVALASDKLAGAGVIFRFVRDSMGTWVKQAEFVLWLA
jgi:hypothetical protein